MSPHRSCLRCCLVPLFGAASVAFGVLLQWPIGHTRARWDQPGNVNYESHDPYVVYVVDGSSWWNEANRNRYCRIGVATLGSSDSQYGHWTEYEFHNYLHDPNYFTGCTVTWTAEGVTLTEPTGHKLFIPKNAFIGGR